MESSTEIEDIKLIAEVKESILNLFTSYSKNRSVRKSNLNTCKLCLNTIPLAKNDEDEPDSQLESDIVGVVLQCLLVPSHSLLRKKNKYNIPIICKVCTNELTKLVDLFLQLEEIRIQFESLRHKVAKQVIRKALGKSERHFKSWKREAERARNILPSEIQSKINAACNRSKDSTMSEDEVRLIPARIASYSNEDDSLPTSQEITKMDKEDGRITQVPMLTEHTEGFM